MHSGSLRTRPPVVESHMTILFPWLKTMYRPSGEKQMHLVPPSLLILSAPPASATSVEAGDVDFQSRALPSTTVASRSPPGAIAKAWTAVPPKLVWTVLSGFPAE